MAVAATTSEEVPRLEMFLSKEEDAMFMITVMGEFEKAHYLSLAQVDGTNVINQELRQYIDQCSVDFRFLCEQTANIAHTHAEGFCDKAIRFFSHLDRLRKSRRIIRQIAERAMQVSKGYMQIRNYCQKLSSRMQIAKRCLSQGTTFFEQRFQIAHSFQAILKQLAKDVEHEAQEKYDETEKFRNECWKIWWVPLVGQVAILGSEYLHWSNKTLLQKWHGEAKRHEAEELAALENLSEAQRLVRGVQTLERFLEDVAGMAEQMAMFWLVQSQKCCGTSGKMSELDEAVAGDDGEDEFIAEEVVEELKTIRDQLQKYAMIAARACTTSNFDVGDLQPTPMAEVTEEEFLRFEGMFQIDTKE